MKQISVKLYHKDKHSLPKQLSIFDGERQYLFKLKNEFTPEKIEQKAVTINSQIHTDCQKFAPVAKFACKPKPAPRLTPHNDNYQVEEDFGFEPMKLAFQIEEVHYFHEQFYLGDGEMCAEFEGEVCDNFEDFVIQDWEDSETTGSQIEGLDYGSEGNEEYQESEVYLDQQPEEIEELEQDESINYNEWEQEQQRLKLEYE
ncbi:Hypothetical_protein [Hexamita inflata]|uniref:Hypothetical_protein n=1 Tax=Hexamita inflata TaxID=28002 RepID=A0AA86N5B9_9EUKA|nr:Hypothetical protein HINF_LOCUS927 [Hexamita inflata]